ncbi:MAG TPA: lipopolysaccharide kinase InaA family protein [bacterium]|nr:lipopolysaccharide kinase InaA family protein [bacterium]HOH67177.1 lipopolysaccharide kinase InaA family protein [bacterium]
MAVKKLSEVGLSAIGDTIGNNEEQNNNQEISEISQEIIDGCLELAIRSEAAEMVNYGNNGVIFKLSPEDLPEDLKEVFLQALPDFIENGQESAFKILKLYTNGKGLVEYNLQAEAYQLLTESEVSEVSVPQPFFYRDLEIKDQETIDLLQQCAVDIDDKEPRIEILAMDFVDGCDLAAWVYRQYLITRKNEIELAYPDIGYENFIVTLEQKGADELMEIICRFIGFKHKYRHNDDSPEAHKERMAFMNKIKPDLVYRNLFDKKLISELIAAISVFHRAGIYHRDLHLRNIMLDQEGKLKIVDFGSAIKIDPNNDLDLRRVYQSDNCYPDNVSIELLRPISKGPEQKIFIERMDKAQALGQYIDEPRESIRRRLLAGESLTRYPLTRYQEISKKAIDNLDEGIRLGKTIQEIIKEFEEIRGKGQEESRFSLAVAVLLEIARQGRADEVIDFCNNELLTIEDSNQRMLYRGLLEYLQ